MGGSGFPDAGARVRGARPVARGPGRTHRARPLERNTNRGRAGRRALPAGRPRAAAGDRRPLALRDVRRGRLRGFPHRPPGIAGGPWGLARAWQQRLWPSRSVARRSCPRWRPRPGTGRGRGDGGGEGGRRQSGRLQDRQWGDGIRSRPAAPARRARARRGGHRRRPRAAGPAGPLAVDDEVIVTFPPTGAYADSVTVPAANVVPKPGGAGVGGGRGDAAWAAPRRTPWRCSTSSPGETLLVHGAAGSVGQIAVQLAVAAGVTVVGTAGERNHELLRGYGAVPVAYGPGWPTASARHAPAAWTPRSTPSGRTRPWTRLLSWWPTAADASCHRGLRARRHRDPAHRRGPGGRPGHRDPGQRLAHPAAGRGRRPTLKVIVTRTYPLAEAADALRFVRDGHAGGKVVLLP